MGLKKDHKGAQSYGAKGLEMGLRALKTVFLDTIGKIQRCLPLRQKNSDNLSQLRPLNCRGYSVKKQHKSVYDFPSQITILSVKKGPKSTIQSSEGPILEQCPDLFNFPRGLK